MKVLKKESFAEIVDKGKLRWACAKCGAYSPNLISKGCPKCGFKPEVISYEEHHKQWKKEPQK